MMECVIIKKKHIYRPLFSLEHLNDCRALRNFANVSGVYTKQIEGDQRRMEVYCDLETDGGGWTVYYYLIYCGSYCCCICCYYYHYYYFYNYCFCYRYHYHVHNHYNNNNNDDYY
ncbi:hypothetical protein DPMN_186486 [Dreissena polymorpha]|uniref:Fibrinogen C-terminal domain-containing protein n=1 Tax=Dreissena polymorpha TaxID=45954 RepID=A0A9D4DMA2_DREPO|nr:hypothetical protein DPMN_186486 [Dreissena polymorpha]